MAPDTVKVDSNRADDIVSPGTINDQVTEAISAADAVVADITDTNPNVMWELGYAEALGRPVVILNQDIGHRRLTCGTGGGCRTAASPTTRCW